VDAPRDLHLIGEAAAIEIDLLGGDDVTGGVPRPTPPSRIHSYATSRWGYAAVEVEIV
jgi:hypothetical protein